MANRNSNPKKQNGAAQSLRERCWARGMSVTELARRIDRNRCTVYFAWADPRKFPVAFRLIQKALSE